MKLRLLFLLFFACHGLLNAQTWEWVSSTSQGNTLRDITRLTATKLVAVGECGAALYSNDNGQSWLNSAQVTQKNLFSVAFRDSMNGFAVGGIMLASNDGGLSWHRRHDIGSSALNTGSYLKIVFPTNTIGYMLAADRIKKTIDGGNSWDSLPYLSNTNVLLHTTFSFSNKDTGYIIGSGFVSGTKIRRTYNGGITWQTPTNFPYGGYLSNIEFDGPKGVIVGGTRTLLYTVNAGINWSILPQNISITGTNNLISIFNDTISHTAFGDSVYYTTPGMTNWITSATLPSKSPLYRHIRDSIASFVLGSKGFMAKSTHLTGSWTTSIQPSPKVTAIAFQDSFLIASVNNNQIMRSFDLGNTWVFDTIPTTSLQPPGLSSFYLLPNGEIIGLGPYSVHKTTIHSSNWTSFPITEWITHAYFQTSLIGIGYQANNRQLFTTVDGGLNWIPQPTPTNTGLILHTYDSIFVRSGKNILRSVNAGLNWDTIYNSNSTAFTDLQIVSSSVYLAVDDSSNIIKSTDYGQTWSRLSNIGKAPDSYTLYFLDADTGYISGHYYANYYKTTDGGNSWDTVYIPLCSATILPLNANFWYAFNQNGIVRLVTGPWPVSLKNNEISIKEEIHIYPNPTTNFVNIHFDNVGPRQIFLNDLWGRKMHHSATTDAFYTLSLEDLPSGTYILRVNSERSNRTTHAKIIKISTN